LGTATGSFSSWFPPKVEARRVSRRKTAQR
jgi:hypothetical protein